MSDLFDRLNAALRDRYLVVGELGRGGMATVFSARDIRHSRDVALKLIHPEVAMALGSERFVREIDLTARLQHPHILPLLDSGTAGNLPFYVMPLVRGVTLRQRIDREGQLPIGEAVSITVQVADALTYAHGTGLVHRDIKPENILLQADHALVADFGIARDLDATDRQKLTDTGMAVGTPLYMSPEQALGDRRIDGRSDQYSLACVLYEMLAGDPPFTGASLQAVVARHTRDPVPPVRTVRPKVPAAVEAALERALSKLPADRFSTAVDFAAALTATGVTPKQRNTSPQWSRAALALLFVGLAGAGGWAVARGWGGAGTAGLDPRSIAILPFTVRCTPAFDTWCEGVDELLGATFVGAGDYRAVDAREVLRASAGRADGADAVRQVARAVGAGTYVAGSVTESGGVLRISAELLPSAARGVPRAEASVQGPTGEIFRLIDGLAGKLVVGLEHGEAGRLSRLAAATTDSLEALKLFLNAEGQVRSGAFDSALTLLSLSVALDSGFTLGWARLSEVAGYTDDVERGTEFARHAAAGAHRLPWRDSMFVAASLARNMDEAEQLYRTLLRADSTDAGAWGALGDVLIHRGVGAGRGYADAERAFSRALQAGDSSWRNINHVGWAAGVLRDTAVFGQALELAVTRFPDGFMSPIHRPEMAVLRRDPLREAEALRELRAADQTVQWGAVQRLAITGNPGAAAKASASFTTPEQPLTVRALGHEMRAAFAVARGQWRAARSELGAAAALAPAGAIEIETYLTLVPGLPVGAEDLHRLAAILGDSRRLPPLSADSSNPWVFPDEGAHAVLRPYLLSLVNARLGAQGAGGATAAEPPGARPAPAVSPLLAEALAASVRAHNEQARGELAKALVELERAPQTIDPVRANGSPFYSQAAERHLRAELLDRLGRPEEALIWFGNAGLVSPFDIAYLPVALKRSGETFEQLGRPAEAAAQYARLLDLWEQADPELQPLLQEVRGRLERLRAGRSP